MIRAEYWITYGTRLRLPFRPAQFVGSTVEPIALPERSCGYTLHIRAMAPAFVAVGTVSEELDAVGHGRLLLAGETAEWIVYPDSYLAVADAAAYLSVNSPEHPNQ